MDRLQELLEEAFHTYQIYLECTGSLSDDRVKLSLLKWPDIAQSAIKLALALKKSNETEMLSIKGDVTEVIHILETDLYSAIIEPISIIHQSTRERITKVLGKEPASLTKCCEGPIELKNQMIDSLNKMFTTLETMTIIEYPRLSKRKNSGSCN